MASTEQKKREETKAMGVFLDDITNVQVSADASPVGDVAHSVAGLVIDNINRKFGLDPPLANDNMDVAWIPNVAADTDISSLDEGLITLVKLNERTSPRVRSRLLENVNSSKVVRVESESIAQLRIEMLSQIGSLKTKADSQGKEINKLSIANADLKANVNTLLKKANLQDKEIVHLKASNAELKTSNTELKTSNTELAATSAQHSKIIGKLRRRIVLDDARKKLTIDYPNTASLQSETFSLNKLQFFISRALGPSLFRRP